MKVIERCLKSFSVPEGTLLACLTGVEGRTRFFFRNGTLPEAVAAPEGVEVVESGTIGGSPVLTCRGLGDGPCPVPLKGAVAQVQPQMPETGLFEGLNTAVTLRNGEAPRLVLDWLGYHARDFGLQAALILDRVRPGANGDLAEALRAAAIPGLSHVVLLTADVPLGKPGLGPEAHPYYAPDAPGKDRMTAPAPDPWQAPMGEMGIYELLRDMFLNRARAVMNIDISDLLMPHEGSTPFDMASEVPGGLVQLVGRRVYPWQLRSGEDATFGDHICRQFDSIGSNGRWCIAPVRIPADGVWRMIRVGRVPPGGHWPFVRCMALRHRGPKVARIVPKSSLIEDDRLLALAHDAFDHRPRRVPEQNIAGHSRRDHTVIVTTMKNEGPFILEWIAYHRAIGVDDFLIYTNDCTDGTDELLDLLQARGIVQRRDNPYRKVRLKPQHAALFAAEDEEMVQKAGWLVCMDVDEYINIHVGQGRLADLRAAVPEANMISMTWRLFGNSDIHAFRDGFITGQFTRCAPRMTRKPHQAWGVKTLYRNIGLFKKMGVHRPKGLHPQLVDEVNWVNGSGRRLPKTFYRNAWRSTNTTVGYDLVTLNHYAVRSAESFLVKRDRGRVNHVERDQGMAYWFRMNNNGEEDRSIQDRLPLLRAEYDRLMADPDIAAAHRHCVARHRERIETLRQMTNYARFYADLTSARMERLSRLHIHFGAGVFLAGPDVVPDEILREDLPPNFFFTVEKGTPSH
nr:glycosyltransferase family 2 protein [Rhodovulum imhoffii]